MEWTDTWSGQTTNNISMTDASREEPTDEEEEADNRRQATNDEDNGRKERKAAEEDEGEEEEEEEEDDDEVSTDLSDKTRQRLSLSGQAPQETSDRRPKLRSTKSFPPYSQPIGGLGYERDSDPESELDREAQPAAVASGGQRHSLPRLNGETPGVTLSGSGEQIAGYALRLEEPLALRLSMSEPLTGCSRDERRARLRRNSGVGIESADEGGGGGGMNLDGWERRERWIGERRMKVTWAGGAGDEGDQSRQGDTEKGVSDGRAGDKEVGHRDAIYSEVEGKVGLVCRRGKRPHRSKWQEGVNSEVCQPHPILSKLLHFSSSESSSSSFGLFSVKGEEVLSEGEDTESRRKKLRKFFSWKTVMSIIHWSLGSSSSTPWVQLAGHQGNFQLSDGGEVLKLFSETEATCLDLLMRDPLRPFVPQYHGLLTRGEECFTRLEDLLGGLTRPIIMDCKMGIRTYQEDERVRCHREPTLRSDMYHKMLTMDPAAPSAEEHEQRAVTKWRYLRWRDATSSTATLGFRIEGIMMQNGSVERDFRKMLSLAQVTEVLLYFTRSRLDILRAYHCRLQALGDALKRSPFFSSHEVIGSSLLFVHDHTGKANVWMIDFGKTTPTPESTRILHNVQWAEGNREDGYLIGLASLTSSLHQAINLASQQQETHRYNQ